MAEASKIKECLESLKEMETRLAKVSMKTEEDASKRMLYQMMIAVNEVVADLKGTVEKLEGEESW